jgi:drug/metabolite transporter (DMT)-like permease
MGQGTMTSKDTSAAPPHTDRILLAVAYCLAAHFLFALMSASAKYLSTTHHVAEIAFYRNFIAVVPFFLFLVLTGRKKYFKTDNPLLIAFRAIVGSISLIVSYAALSYLPMSYATVLFFTSFLLSPVLAHFFLKEYVGIHRWSAVFVGMIGVLVIAQPSGEVSMIGLCLALLAAVLHAMMYTSLRLLKDQSPLTVTFYFVLAGTIVPGLAMPWIAHLPSPDQIPLFLLLGISGGLAQLCLSSAYKYAPVSLITPFGYSGLLWGVLFDVYVWKYEIDFHAVLIGAGIILAAKMYILYRECVWKIQREKTEIMESGK